MKLPEQTRINLVHDRSSTASCDDGFLRLRRVRLKNTYADQTQSTEYAYDVVERTALDAVVIVLWGMIDGEPALCLRTSLRPPLAFRDRCEVPEAPNGETLLWEVPAGLIEPEEKGEQGILRCASRETLEEAGFIVSADSFQWLGSPTYLCPGVIPERLYYVHAQVQPTSRGEPTEDGSQVEARADIRMVALSELLVSLDKGVIRDAKTEVAIMRFVRWYKDAT